MSADRFDAARHLANSPDLQASHNADLRAATIYFIGHGFQEQHTDAPLRSIA